MLTDSLGRGGSSTEWKAVMQELNLHKEEVDRLREEIEESRQIFKHEVEALVDQVFPFFCFFKCSGDLNNELQWGSK